VKAKEKNAKPQGRSQKTQLLVLGSLLAVLGVVVAVQFGGGDPSAGPVASAASAPPDASAPQPSAAPAAPSAPAAPAVAAAATSVPSAASAVADNPVLSQPLEDAGLPKSPFASFWNVAKEGASAGSVVPAIAPPSITLNATMPSDTRALAVIDGEMHFVGDLIQGWELAEIGSRRVVLRSADRSSVTFEMPLLSGARAVPGAVADG
jgi:hypothetical protein